MKNASSIFIRLGRVVYFLVLIIALSLAIVAGYPQIPKVVTYYHPIVHCNNGTSYDPNAKSVRFYGQGNNGKNDYDGWEMSSVCQYGDRVAYLFQHPDVISSIYAYPKNFTLEYTKTYQTQGSWTKVIENFVLVFLGAFLITEISKRTLRYIFFGKSFFSLR